MWKVIQVIRFNTYNRPRFLPLSGGFVFFMFSYIQPALAIAKSVTGTDKGKLAIEIYLEGWGDILRTYGRETLEKIRDQYALHEQYETCSEIQKHL